MTCMEAHTHARVRMQYAIPCLCVFACLSVHARVMACTRACIMRVRVMRVRARLACMHMQSVCLSVENEADTEIMRPTTKK